MQHFVAAGRERPGAVDFITSTARASLAVVFDIDDTLLNTYDYEIANQSASPRPANAVLVTRPRSSRR